MQTEKHKTTNIDRLHGLDQISGKLHTKIESISSCDSGVLFGWREAIPPPVLAGLFEPEKKVWGPLPATGLALFWEAASEKESLQYSAYKQGL